MGTCRHWENLRIEKVLPSDKVIHGLSHLSQFVVSLGQPWPLDPWSKIYEEVVVWMELLIMKTFLTSQFLCRSRLTIDGHSIVVLVIMALCHYLGASN